MKTLKILLLAAFLIVAGCQDVTNLHDPETFRTILNNEANMEMVFESFWNGMNNSYVFWDIDPTDWDEVYRIYKPKFAALDALGEDISSQDDLDKLLKTAKRYFVEMTKDLVDSHLYIRFDPSFDPSEELIIPSETRYGEENFGVNYMDENSGYHESEKIIETAARANYRAVNVYLSDDQVSWEGDGMCMAAGRIPLNSSDNILYFQLSSFALTQMVAYEEAQEVLFYFSDNLRAPDIKGVIVDLRGNGGGDANDLSLIWGQTFAKEKHLVGYSKHKMGDGRLDYAPLTPFYFYGDPEVEEDLKVPLVLLVNKGSASCSEISALFVRSLPNGYIVGGTTWGAHGPLTLNMLYNAGQYSSPQIDLVFTSSIQTLDLNKVSHEGKGIVPDYPVPFEYDNFRNLIDARLEKAIEVVIEKQ